MPYICKCCGTHQPGQSDGWCGRPECRSAADISKRTLRESRDAQIASRDCSHRSNAAVDFLCTDCGLLQKGGVWRSAADIARTHGRASGACTAQSPVAGMRGVFSYCTRERGHEGDHIAATLEGETVARWPSGAGGDEAPR